MKSTVLLLSSFLFILSCSRSNKNATQTSDNILYSVPFKGEGTPRININLNDSIQIPAIFDTGCPVPLAITEHLTDSLNISKYNLKIKIEDSIQKMVDSTIIIPKTTPLGKRTLAILGYSIFKDEIVKISWKDKSLSILKDTIFLTDYIRIPFTINDLNPTISVTFYSQGQQTRLKDICIDTGLNGSSFLLREDRLNKIKSFTSTDFGIPIDGSTHSINRFKADSIIMGNLNIKDLLIHTAPPTFSKGFSNKDGLIGTSILNRFDVVFDFKNKIMYLKPLYERL